MRYIPIPPVSWPQDELVTLHGHGDMTRINAENKVLTRQEAFVYGGNFVLPAPASAVLPSVGSLIIKIEADADFWCNQIIMDFTDPATPTEVSQVLWGFPLQITDIRSGYNFFYPTGSVDMIANQNTVNTVFNGGAIGMASNMNRFNGTLMQPYCFTRNGGINISVVNNLTGAAVGPQTCYVSFFGWKEFEYASQ